MDGTTLVDSLSETLHERYQLQSLLGSGGSGETYSAVDLQNGQQVAVKLMSLRRAPNWKAVELFEREAKILAQLDHPAIPKYIDFFRTTIAGEDFFGIVQQLALGRSLATWMADGMAFTEKDLRKIAVQILEILSYLQSFVPPLIHRDIKPQNILMTDSGVVSLVDFGAVRDSYHLTITGGSTLVGTYGYMAPEQFRGQAVLATDLYGLGATMVYLLTGIDPADLPQKHLRIQFRERIKVSEQMTTWLERTLEPVPEDRFADAARALQALNSNRDLAANAPRPKQPIARLVDDGTCLRISIPAIWMASQVSRRTLGLIFPLLALEFFLIWLTTAASINAGVLVLIGIALLSITPWLLYWGYYYLYSIATRQEILLSADSLKLKTLLGSRVLRQSTVEMKNIKTVFAQATRTTELDKGIRIAKFLVPDGTGRYLSDFEGIFGKFLDYPEQCWVAREMEEHIRFHQNNS
jgi:eukaryotic-like serine/threonine-protein kinase